MIFHVKVSFLSRSFIKLCLLVRGCGGAASYRSTVNQIRQVHWMHPSRPLLLSHSLLIEQTVFKKYIMILILNTFAVFKCALNIIIIFFCMVDCYKFSLRLREERLWLLLFIRDGIHEYWTNFFLFHWHKTIHFISFGGNRNIKSRYWKELDPLWRHRHVRAKLIILFSSLSLAS